MTSSGTLNEIKHSTEVARYDTHLKKSFDFEGLAYLPPGNQLLLASKASGPKTKSHLRKIFSFDLDDKKLKHDPWLVLDCRSIARHLQEGKKSSYFSPSAICTDSNHDLFIISSVAQAIIVVDTLGTIKSVAKLDPALHIQPEGIVIDDQGILYIANEGKTSSAKIFTFNPKT